MIATNREAEEDPYLVLRHLFDAARRSSVSDKEWHFFGSNTEPGRVIFTEYEHEFTGDRVSCQSYRYDEETGKYMSHMFTFRKGVKP